MDAVPAAFRDHFTRHNRRALALALVTLVLAALAWGLVYFFVCWLVLLVLTVARGVDAALPDSLSFVFAGGALFLCLCAWIVWRIAPFDRARDRTSALASALDVVLAIPRATLAVWGNLSACRRLDARELAAAWRLVRRIDDERRLSVYQLPVEIPEARMQERVVGALQLSGLVEFRKTSDSAVLMLRDEAARKLVRRMVRLRLPAGKEVRER